MLSWPLSPQFECVSTYIVRYHRVPGTLIYNIKNSCANGKLYVQFLNTAYRTAYSEINVETKVQNMLIVEDPVWRGGGGVVRRHNRKALTTWRAFSPYTYRTHYKST